MEKADTRPRMALCRIQFTPYEGFDPIARIVGATCRPATAATTTRWSTASPVWSLGRWSTRLGSAGAALSICPQWTPAKC